MPNLKITVAALGTILALTACNSSGNTRYASIGKTGPQGVAGPAGKIGATGATGKTGATGATGAQGMPGMVGPQGPAGEPGGNFALGDTGMIATGGLVGAEGVAGTGLFANLGDPSASIPVVSDTSAGGGTAIASLGGGLDDLIGQVDQTGTLSTVTSPVTETVSNVGTTLTSFGTDGAPLVDGLTSSVAPILTASVGGGTALGDSSGTSVLGVSVLSPDQTSGSLAAVGVASNDTLLNVDLATSSDTGVSLGGLASVDLGPVTAGLNDLGGASDLTGTLDGGLTDTVGDTLTSTVGDVLSGDLAPADPADTPVGSAVSGLLGGFGLN
ncbi:hypothetical protein [Hyphomonas oceanitis]|uniref:hypothetical protein n=1 Tax=Hyphomonas oceanitis TaxID=81033 RepID=UPI0030028A12